MNSELIKVRNIIINSIIVSCTIGGTVGFGKGFGMAISDYPYCYRNHCIRKQLKHNGSKDTIGQATYIVAGYSISGMIRGILWPKALYDKIFN